MINNLTPSADGYTFDPVEYEMILMDGNKTVSFVATAGAAYQPLDTEWVPNDGAVTIVQNDITYTGSSRARNDKVNTGGVDGGFKCLLGVFGGIGLGDNNSSMSARNDMWFGVVREGNNKFTFFSKGVNLFETAGAQAVDAVAEIVLEEGNWLGLIDGIQVISMARIPADYKINSIGDAGSFVNDIESYGFE